MEKKIVTYSSKQHKGKIKYELKETISNAVQKLQQIIVRVQKLSYTTLYFQGTSTKMKK